MTDTKSTTPRPSPIARFLTRNAPAIITALGAIAAAFVTAFGISEHRRDNSEVAFSKFARSCKTYALNSTNEAGFTKGRAMI